MAIKIIQNLVSSSKYSIKCPNMINPTRIVVHNTANDASARNEVSYMISNANQTSFHFAVDDKEVVQGIPLNRNAWHAGDGNGKGNLEGISIEICYSKSGGERFTKAEKLTAKLIAQLLTERKWDISKVTKHQDYSKKYCPHRTLDLGWERFLNLIKVELGQAVQTPQKPTQTVTESKPDVFYRVRTKEDGWLPEVKNLEDFAGWKNHQITDVALRVSKGSVRYRVHIKGAGWLPYVTGYNVKDCNNGYAGTGTPIDLLEVIYYPPSGAKYKVVKYRVAPSTNPTKYYDWQKNVQKTNGQDGYAGVKGVAISALQMVIE